MLLKPFIAFSTNGATCELYSSGVLAGYCSNLSVLSALSPCLGITKGVGVFFLSTGLSTAFLDIWVVV